MAQNIKMAKAILFQNGTILSHDEDDNHVNVLRDTDLLVEGDRITQIGKNIKVQDGAEVLSIDCTGKIVSPGFINTHAHLWQTQLKGRHADETLLDYFVSGNIQHHNYTADDIFWGQLAGAMESIDTGTTTILDHSQCCANEEMANEALSGIITSGIRGILAYMKPPNRLEKWDQTDIVAKRDEGGLDLGLDHLEYLASKQPYEGGRVTIGMAFDMYFLPEAMVKSAFARAMAAGINVVTSHVVQAPVFGPHSAIQTLKDYDLLTTTPNLVLSHCTNVSPSDLELLAQTQTRISATPETEAQMGHGHPPLFHPGLNVSVGVDCHTNNTSFMPQIARTGLFCARLTTNEALLAQQKFPGKLRGDTERAFNAITMQGAKALGMEKEIGSLRVGKKADLVVFDAVSSLGMSCVAMTDPLVAVLRHSDVRDVQVVVVDGVVRKWEGKICPVTRHDLRSNNHDASGAVAGEGKEGSLLDWEKIRSELLRSTRDVWARDATRSRKLGWDFTVKSMYVDTSKIVDVD